MSDILLDESTWTYTGQPATVPRDHVRELVQDTDPDKKKVSDGTVALALSERGDNAYFAAAKICRMLAAKFADRPSVSHEGMSENWPTVAENYLKLAEKYEEGGQELSNQAAGFSAPKAVAHSISALEAALADTDRNSGVFHEGMLWDPGYDPRF
jgi:hypothetical protein